MNKRDLVNALNVLSDIELVEVLSDVLPNREPYKTESLVNRSNMFLGIYSKTDEEEFVEAIAYPDGEIEPDWGFCQNGNSEIENIEYTSNSKNCISPFNGEKVYLT